MDLDTLENNLEAYEKKKKDEKKTFKK